MDRVALQFKEPGVIGSKEVDVRMRTCALVQLPNSPSPHPYRMLTLSGESSPSDNK